jgi:hypothetical protein
MPPHLCNVLNCRQPWRAQPAIATARQIASAIKAARIRVAIAFSPEVQWLGLSG